MSRRRKKHGIKWRSLYQWHRMLGIAAGVFVLLLAITGLMINHTESLELDERYAQADWLLDWYGIAPPADAVSYRLGEHWISQLGSRVYLNGEEIPGSYGRLLGVAGTRELLVIAVEGEIVLLTPTGRLVEKLGHAQGVPAGMQSVGLNEAGDIVVAAAHGYYIADEALLSWRERDAVQAHWASQENTPPALHARLVTAYRGKGLTMERVLLDLHSGRILGSRGELFMDGIAILFILLASTGIWLWAKRKR